MVVLIFTSSKKEVNKMNESMTGSWVGKYGSGNSDPIYPYHFEILPEGKLNIIDTDKEIIGKGTWYLAHKTFTSIYSYEGGGVFHLEGKYNKEEAVIKGQWGEGARGISDGKFYLER